MKDLSLRIKFSAWVTFAVLLITVPMLMYHTQQKLALLNASFIQNQETLLNILKLDAKEALETGLFDHVHSRFDTLVQRSDIYAIELRDENNKTLVASPSTPIYTGEWVVQTINQKHRSGFLRLAGEKFEDNSIKEIQLGTLSISFNTSGKKAQLNQLITETGVLLILAVMFALACVFLTNHFVTRRIACMADALIGIQKGNYHPNLNHDTNDELGKLAKQINETGTAIEHYEQSLKKDRDKTIAEHAARTEKEVRSLFIIQNSMTEVRKNIEASFSKMLALIQENNANEFHALIADMIESLRSVDDVQMLLEKDEPPNHPHFFTDTLTHCASGFERGLKIIASRKNFPMTIKIDPLLNDSNPFILIDIQATLHLLALALEYWPQQLGIRNHAWQININLNSTGTIIFDLSVEGAPLTSKHWGKLHSHLTHGESKSSSMPALQIMLRKLSHNTGLQHSITIKENNRIHITYESRCITGENKADILTQAKTRYGNQKHIALIGGSNFLESTRFQFEHLFIDVCAIPYQSILNNEYRIDSQYGMALVDVDSDKNSARAVLEMLNQNEYPELLRIAMSHQPGEQFALSSEDNMQILHKF